MSEDRPESLRRSEALTTVMLRGSFESCMAVAAYREKRIAKLQKAIGSAWERLRTNPHAKDPGIRAVLDLLNESWSQQLAEKEATT